MTGFIRRSAEGQGGHVTTAQLLAVIDERTVGRWVAAGRLIRVHRGVYAVGHLPTHPVDRAHGALLACGPRSALAGESAMVLWGLWRRWPARFEVVSAVDRRVSTVNVRVVRTLLQRDVVLEQGVRVTSPARMLLDMAARLGERRLKRALEDLRLDRKVTVAAVRDVLARNPNAAGSRLLRDVVGRVQREPTRSQLEDSFLTMCARYHVPVPTVNLHVAGYRVDGYYEEQRLIVELDGWDTHGTREAFKRDRRQDAEILERTGIPTVRLAYDDTQEPLAGETAQRLRTLLATVRLVT